MYYHPVIGRIAVSKVIDIKTKQPAVVLQSKASALLLSATVFDMLVQSNQIREEITL